MATPVVLEDSNDAGISVGVGDDVTITAPFGGIYPTSGTSYALMLDAAYVSTVENSGSIVLRNPDMHSYGGTDETEAYGILVTGDLGDGTDIGVIENIVGASITVDVPHISDDESADPRWIYAAGIYVDDSLLAGSQITNAGTVTVSADGSVGELVGAAGMGSYLGSAAGAAISNSGTVSVAATGSGTYIYATGIVEGSATTYTSGGNSTIVFYGSTSGDIVNSGDILAEATVYGVASSESVAYASGIYTTLLTDGSIENSNSISATATMDANSGGYGYALAHGIWVEEGADSTSTIASNGSVNVTADASGDADAYAFGVEVGSASEYYDYGSDGAMDGTMTLGGDITATAHQTSPVNGAAAAAYGVSVMLAGAGSLIETTGTISANASAEDGALAMSNGMLLALSDGTLTLDGDINATSNATGSGFASANGVNIAYSGSDALFETTGTITAVAHANEDGLASATGVVKLFDFKTNTADGEFKLTDLSGSISVEATGASALAVGSLEYFSWGTITQNSGTIEASATTYNAGDTDGALLYAPLLANRGISGESGAINYLLYLISGFYGGIGGLTDNLNGAVGMGSVVNIVSAVVNAGDINVAFDLQDTAEPIGLYGAAGMGVVLNLGGMVANTGTITATAVNAPAAGIAVMESLGLVLNTGTIEVDASGEARRGGAGGGRCRKRGRWQLYREHGHDHRIQ